MKSQQPDDARIEREAKFHDAWALSTNVKDILVTSCFEAPTAVENMAIIKAGRDSNYDGPFSRDGQTGNRFG
jgi:hypothetical protein